MSYEQLLDKALKQVPEKITDLSERFEIPRVISRIQGNRTIFDNFIQMVSLLRREQDHLIKFLSRELASPAQMENNKLVLVGKIGNDRLNQKIQAYAKEFVICHECGKPDTELTRKQRFLFVRCLACGAEHSVRSKIA